MPPAFFQLVDAELAERRARLADIWVGINPPCLVSAARG
jgi:hypothetical protein